MQVIPLTLRLDSQVPPQRSVDATNRFVEDTGRLPVELDLRGEQLARDGSVDAAEWDSVASTIAARQRNLEEGGRLLQDAQGAQLQLFGFLADAQSRFQTRSIWRGRSRSRFAS